MATESKKVRRLPARVVSFHVKLKATPRSTRQIAKTIMPTVEQLTRLDSGGPVRWRKRPVQ